MFYFLLTCEIIQKKTNIPQLKFYPACMYTDFEIVEFCISLTFATVAMKVLKIPYNKY